MELTKEQEHISEAIQEWVSSSNTQSMALAGYAGTGKTTVLGVTSARIGASNPGIKIAYCAPTGKASLVLRNKLQSYGALNDSAYVGTVHGLIYRPKKGKKGSSQPVFEKRGFYEVTNYDLLVVDEASMVTKRMYNDLLSYGKPVLFVGDSGQLPPVGDDLFAPLQETPYALTEVHRQAKENPIIQIATDVREGREIPYRMFNNMVARLPSHNKTAITAINTVMGKARESDMMTLCGLNSTRLRLNARARGAQKFISTLPQAGERLVCLRNDKATNLRNGELVTVVRCEDDDSEHHCYALQVEEFPGKIPAFRHSLYAKDGSVINRQLGAHAENVAEYLEEKMSSEIALFDFGYALSVHKAQGSEWEKVLLFNERNSNQTQEEYIRWLYTGITRAKKCLLIVG